MNINKTKLTNALRNTYPTLRAETAAKNVAEQLCRELDPRVEEALAAWIEGNEIPDVPYGEFSIRKIMKIRQTDDVLVGIRLLSLYMKDPDAGIEKIHAPIRGFRRK